MYSVCRLRSYVFGLLKVKQRLRLNHRNLLRVSRERVNMQFASAGLEVYIAERLQTPVAGCLKLHKYSSIASKSLKVGMTLLIQVRIHLLNLKIGHITQTSAQRAFVRTRAAELKPLNQPSLRQQLPRRTYNLAQAYRPGKHADHVCASRHPDKSLILLGLHLTLGINLEKFGMNRPLEKTERQLFNCYIYLRCFHSPRTNT